MKNCILVILDSVGIGALPDADEYGDSGAATLQNIMNSAKSVDLPNLEALGLGKIEPLKGINPDISTQSTYGKLASLTFGKDTTVGHWELMGLPLKSPLKTFPNGFTDEILDEFTKLSGYGVIGGHPASGTEIIKELGQKHEDSGKLIVYTSADSVFQIAANEKLVPIDELYRVCEIARKICDKHSIARVIARPYILENGQRVRTKNRKDYSLKPFSKTALNFLSEKKITTIGIGKIDDIFASNGIDKKIYVKGNEACMDETFKAMKDFSNSLIFTNLVDFDMLYGHRRNPQGYYDCIKDFDNLIPKLISALDDDDLLILTADHGNDPCFKGTDHTREYIPFIAYSKKSLQEIDLGVGTTFADIGKSILDFYNVENGLPGTSFIRKMKI